MQVTASVTSHLTVLGVLQCQVKVHSGIAVWILMMASPGGVVMEAVQIALVRQSKLATFFYPIIVRVQL